MPSCPTAPSIPAQDDVESVGYGELKHTELIQSLLEI